MLEAVVQLADGRRMIARGYCMETIQKQLEGLGNLVAYKLTRRPIGCAQKGRRWGE